MITRTFLGTGLLGTGMVEGALSRGESVRVWNRTPSRAAPLVALGASLHLDVSEAVEGADIVHLVLTNDVAVDAVLEALRPSLADLAARGVAIADHSTTSPVGTAARALWLHAAGVGYAHAPVFMSPNAARAAQGTMLVAGPAATFAQLSPLLGPMCEALRHVGARTDLAAAMKLFGNAMNLTMLHGLADILSMAQGLDIPAEQALDVFGMIDVRTALDGRGRNMAKGHYDPLWTVDVARKDVALMLGCAPLAPCPALHALAASLDQRQAEGAGELDVAVLGRASRPPAE